MEHAQPTISAIPTLAHMALVEMQNRGLLKHLISSNCDGLHVKSGILPQHITEVHGNSNSEECCQCERHYYRDFPTHARVNRVLAERAQLTGRAEKHFTGRHCFCGGPLCDTIINFGENLSEKAIQDGFQHGRQADLMVAMGASLTVSPSCDMVAATKKSRGKLVIINLQKTPYDDICDLRIFAKTDAVWARVMKHLAIPVPPFTLRRRLCLYEDGGAIKLVGIAADGTPATWVKSAASVSGPTVTARFQRVDTPLQEVLLPREALAKDLAVFSYGHYQESPFLLRHNDVLPAVIACVFSPHDGSWHQEVECDGGATVAQLRALLNQNDNNAVAPEHQDAGKAPEGGFAVYPKLDCPHIAQLDLNQLQVDTQAPCDSCGDKKENWLCLCCSKVFCSRYVEGHMVKHVAPGRMGCAGAVVASFSDFSFWCNTCDEYVASSRLAPVKRAMELSKFGN